MSPAELARLVRASHKCNAKHRGECNAQTCTPCRVTLRAVALRAHELQRQGLRASQAWQGARVLTNALAGIVAPANDRIGAYV